MSSALAAPAVSSAVPATGFAALMANPMFLPLLLAFGPAAISKLFGHKTPEQKAREQIEQLLANRAKMTTENFRQVVSSPAYSAAQGSIATGANQASNNVAANLAERGIGTTGTGAVLSGLTPSLVGSQQSALLANAHKQATDMFESEFQKRIADGGTEDRAASAVELCWGQVQSGLLRVVCSGGTESTRVVGHRGADLPRSSTSPWFTTSADLALPPHPGNRGARMFG